MTRLITLEGLEGCFKSTQTELLVKHLESTGANVLQVKEPGTHQLPLTMELRRIMLDDKYSDQHTALSRELVSQAARSIHLNKLVVPAINSGEYQYIISDRGVFSSVAYASALGHTPELIANLTDITHSQTGLDCKSYDIIFLERDTAKGLETAQQAKQEFETGDAMEKMGTGFLDKVKDQFESWASDFNVSYVDVENKSKEIILSEIITKLGV